MLHIGVTSDSLLVKKAYKEFLEPFEVRKASVLTFIKTLNPHQELNVFELSDPVGLAGSLPELEACILTREVEKGGQMVNDQRAASGLKPVELVFVNMILAEHGAKDKPKNFSNKVSSTHIREYLANQKQK